MGFVGDREQMYFSTTDANYLRRQFCIRMGLTREQFYEWIRDQSVTFPNRAIARIILDTVPVVFAEGTVRKWVGHWVRDAQQDLEQVAVWRL